MSKGRINDFYAQYEELVIKYEKQELNLKQSNIIISSLNKTIGNLNETIINLNNEIKELKEEILRIKSKNNRDSSNSSKPSGTNGFKNVPTNGREKSSKSKGGQIGHNPHSLNNKYQQFISSGNVIEEIIEINKNENNKNKRYIEKIVIDLKICKLAKKYRYYPDENGKYNIPKEHNQYVKYGNNIKAICVDLMNNLYNSTDGVTRFIEDITNGGMTISKGTLVLWNKEIANNLSPEIDNIESKLLNSYYINHDETSIKIDGDGNNILCACNKMHTRLWVHEHKSQDALKEIGFLPKYKGIIVKDGTELYNPFGLFLSQCLAHILRYLKPYFIDIKHNAPKKMYDFLKKYNKERNELIEQKIVSFEEVKYKDIIKEYDSILEEWETELRNDTNNYLFNDEYCLYRRMKYDNKNMDEKYRGDREEILFFLRDFKVPSTNNSAEAAQRPAKIKQKIGKFRSTDGAKNYAVIRSCISTYKKNKINVLEALTLALSNKPIIV